MAVGAFNLTVSGANVGAAWVIPGSYILSLDTEAFESFTPPLLTHPFSPPGSEGAYRIEGTTVGGRFGRAVAWMPPSAEGEGALLAVSAPLANVNETDLVGEVTIYQAGSNGIDPVPVGRIQGVESAPNSLWRGVGRRPWQGRARAADWGSLRDCSRELNETHREHGTVYRVEVP